MLQVLVESRAIRERSGRWAGVSIAVHSALIGLTLYLTAAVAPSVPRDERVETLVYTAPAPRTPVASAPVAAAAPNAISGMSVTVPALSLPALELPISDVFNRVLEDLSRATTGSPVGTVTGAPALPGGIYTAATVDRIVMPLPGNASPTYPARLSSAGVEGEVLARFVVDTTGRVETKSIEILQASHALFGEAVKHWLRENRYSAALVSGRPVRQLVQQRIGFTLTR